MTVKETTVACVTFLFAAAFAAPCHAQTIRADNDEARIADLVTASHMLANEGILDSFGHVSAAPSKIPNASSCRARWRRRSSPAPTSSRSGSTASPSRPMRPG